MRAPLKTALASWAPSINIIIIIIIIIIVIIIIIIIIIIIYLPKLVGIALTACKNFGSLDVVILKALNPAATDWMGCRSRP